MSTRRKTSPQKAISKWPDLDEKFAVPHSKALAYLTHELDIAADWDSPYASPKDQDYAVAYFARDLLSTVRGGEGRPPRPLIPSAYLNAADKLLELVQRPPREGSLATAVALALMETLPPRKRP